MSFAQENRTILRSMTDNNNPDLDEGIMDGRTLDAPVEITISAGPACEESKDALEQAIATGTENEIAVFQTSCDNVCGETCTIATEDTIATKDSNANTNFISAILTFLTFSF